MSQERCEQLVERYMAGAMSHAEEEAFFIQVAVEDDLRRTLKAYRIIDSSIRKEREASAHGHHTARERVAAAFLAASPERAVPMPEPSATPAITSSRWGSTSSIRRLLAGLTLTMTILFIAFKQPWQHNITPVTLPDSSSTLRLAPDVPLGASRDDIRQDTLDMKSSSAVHQDLSVSASKLPTIPGSTSAQVSNPAPKQPVQHSRSTESPGTPTLTADTSISVSAIPVDSIPRSETNQDTMRLPVRIDWQIK